MSSNFESHLNNYKMNNQSPQKVEFFNSQSSFGSESNVSSSRFYDFTNEILSQTDNIFLTLKRQLVPNQSHVQTDKLKYIISRAQLIHKDTIPEHLSYLQKVDAPRDAKDEVKKCQEKLKNVVADYEKYKNNHLSYKQFYNLYGKQFNKDNASFKRGSNNIQYNQNLNLTPEYIEINYNVEPVKLKGTARLASSKAEPYNRQKQYNQMRDEISKLKKNEQDAKRQFERTMNKDKILAEKRIIQILKTRIEKEGDEGFKKLLLESQQKLNDEIVKNQKYLTQNAKLLERVQELKHENEGLRQEVERYRKMEGSVYEQNLNDKSYNSEYQMGKDTSKKQDKAIKNLISQKELLKTQLNRQRQANYKLKSKLADQDNKELQKVKKLLQKKSQQLQHTYLQLDKQRVQNLQINHNHKTTSKILQNLKIDHQNLKKIAQSGLVTTPNQPHKDAAGDLAVVNRMPKVYISSYQGQGLEGLAYYQILNKQFKTRFRRACLREKELLYKANGIEIGVITAFTEPNLINILIHVTNYSNKDLNNLKIKIINGNQNIIKYDINQITKIPSNEQIKIPITVILNYYPIGPVILLLSSNNVEKEDLRILLPAHIFKTMAIQPRNDDIKNHSQVIRVDLQKKIAKDLSDLQQYFPKSQIKSKMIKLSLFHKQSHTFFQLDLIEDSDRIRIDYEHLQGNQSLTEYFIKTLTFLLSK